MHEIDQNVLTVVFIVNGMAPFQIPLDSFCRFPRPPITAGCLIGDVGISGLKQRAMRSVLDPK